MEDNKMMKTIEKKLEVKVEEVIGIIQEGKKITLDVCIGGDACMKVVLQEMRNKYGLYYKMVSENRYMREPIQKVQPIQKKSSAKLRTKTERLCGARRRDIIHFAKQRIKYLVDGTATLKEIEGPAKEDTAIRFVLILKADGSRLKEDIDVTVIRENIEV